MHKAPTTNSCDGFNATFVMNITTRLNSIESDIAKITDRSARQAEKIRHAEQRIVHDEDVFTKSLVASKIENEKSHQKNAVSMADILESYRSLHVKIDKLGGFPQGNMTNAFDWPDTLPRPRF